MCCWPSRGSARTAEPGASLARARAVRRLLQLVALTSALLLLVLAFRGVTLSPARLAPTLAAASAALGRPVTVGAVRLWLLPGPGLELRELVLGEGSGGAAAAPHAAGPRQAPLRLSRLRAELRLLPALFTLGRRLAVERVEVDGAELDIVRLPDGSLSTDDVARRLAARLPWPPPPALRRWASRVSLDGATIRGRAALRAVTQSGSLHTLAVEGIELALGPVALGRPVELRLSAAVASGATDVRLVVTTAPLGEGLGAVPPAEWLRRAELRAGPLEAAPLLAWLAPSLPPLAPQQGRFELDLHLAQPGGSRLLVGGTVAVRQLVLRQGEGAGSRGRPTDLALRAEVDADWEAGALFVQGAELSVDDMAIGAEAELRDLWNAPRAERLVLSSRGLRLERLTAVVPPLTLPSGLRLAGPVRLYGSASGPRDRAQVVLGVDLREATLSGLVLDKRPGVAGAAELRATLTPQGIQVERLGAVLGPLALWATGRVRSPRDLELRMDSGWVPLAPALRLSPEALRRLPARSSLAGGVAVRARLRRQGELTEAAAELDLRAGRLVLPGARLAGSGRIQGGLQRGPRGDAVTLDAELGRAALAIGGWLRKPAGAPLHIQLAASQAGRRLHLSRAELRGPGLTLTAQGDAEPETSWTSLTLRGDAQLASLQGLFPPLAAARLPAARLQGAVQLEGELTRPSSLRLQGQELLLHVAGGELRGSVDVTGLDGGAPSRLAFDLQGRGLELEQLWALRPPRSPRPGAAPLAHAGRSAPPWLAALRAMTITGRLSLSDLAPPSGSLRELELALNLEGGRLAVTTLRAAIFGGSLSASGSSAELSQEPPAFSLRGRLDGIDLARLLATVAPASAGRAVGRLSAVLQLSSAGLSGPALLSHLRGTAGLTLADGELRDVTVRAKIKNGEIKGLVGPDGLLTLHRDRIGLRAVTARASLHDGRVELLDAVRLANEELVMELRGQLTLDGRLWLRGALELLPAAFANATSGRVQTAAAVPVQLRVTGTSALPLVELEHLDETVSVLSGGLLGATRAPELYAPQPVPGQPGRDASASAPPLRLLRPERPRYMFNLRIGASLGLAALPHQVLVGGEAGLAVTPDRHGYLVLGFQAQLAGGLVGLSLPLGFQYDFRLPIRHLYLSPRLSVGYAVLFDSGSITPMAEHLATVMAEVGLTYSPIRRFNFGLVPVSAALLFDGAQLRAAYRLMAIGGVNF